MGARELNLAEHKIILFDGVCNLCNGSVNFLIWRDEKGIFKYSPLQSNFSQNLIEKLNIPDNVDSIILVHRNRYYLKSDAVIEIIKELKWYWKIFLIGSILPRKLRDKIYDVIANHRYNWFGKRDKCMIPTEDVKSRFIED